MKSDLNREASREATLASLKRAISHIECGSQTESRITFDAPDTAELAVRNEDDTGNKSPVKACDKSTEGAKQLIDNDEAAYQKILRLLNYRDRTSHELAERLQRDGFSPRATYEALDRATRLGLVDDTRYCRNYIDQSFRAGKGRRVVENDLKRKGFSQADILLHLSTSVFEEENEEERAYQFLLKHPPRGKNIRESAFRKLVSKGYSINAASKSAVRYFQETTQQ
mgnify:CR=1 FL=1